MADANDRKRVVVTGIGAITPMGVGVEANWRGLLDGRSAVSHVQVFEAATYRTRIAGQVKPEDFARYCEGPGISHGWGRNTRFAKAAADQAESPS